MDCRAVLIIEDDVPTQLLLTAIVSRNGLQATIASDGCEALELLSARDYDLILLDLQLPLIHGSVVLRELATSRPHLLERIVVVTAAHPTTYRECVEVDETWAVVRKPFDLDTLEHALLECWAERVRTVERTSPHAFERGVALPQLRRVH